MILSLFVVVDPKPYILLIFLSDWRKMMWQYVYVWSDHLSDNCKLVSPAHGYMVRLPATYLVLFISYSDYGTVVHQIPRTFEALHMAK